jgi:hypothetical protein
MRARLEHDPREATVSPGLGLMRRVQVVTDVLAVLIAVRGMTSAFAADRILRQLRQFEAYGVTTVMALGANGPLPCRSAF